MVSVKNRLCRSILIRSTSSRVRRFLSESLVSRVLSCAAISLYMLVVPSMAHARRKPGYFGCTAKFTPKTNYVA